MKTIEKEIKNQIEIKKSKFFTILIPLEEENMDIHLEEIKKMYPNATHYCYAYRFLGKSRCSDDGEPSKTAGMPILNVLERQDIDCILAVVIRYFGGIKLGANGLVRAYTEAITSALQKATITNLIDGFEIELKFSYQKEKEILYLLQNSTITKKEYDTLITYQVIISEEVKNVLDTKGISYQLLKKIKIRG